MRELKVEVNARACVDRSTVKTPNNTTILITPPVGEDFWLMRVRLSKRQAIVAFPKFGTIGCGFQQEGEDWNTNLPIGCDSEQIYNHIKANKGDAAITKGDCIKAIDMLRAEALRAGAIKESDVERMKEAGTKIRKAINERTN